MLVTLPGSYRIARHSQPTPIMGIPMSITTTEHYHAVVVSLKGEFFGSIQGPVFSETLAQLRRDGKTNIVFDLSRTTLMDSSGIGVLIEALKELRSLGGDLRLAELETKMRNLFLMTRLLGEVFEIFDTVDEAVESFAEPVLA